MSAITRVDCLCERHSFTRTKNRTGESPCCIWCRISTQTSPFKRELLPSRFPVLVFYASYVACLPQAYSQLSLKRTPSGPAPTARLMVDFHWRVFFYVREKIRDNVWTACVNVYASRSYIVSKIFYARKITSLRCRRTTLQLLFVCNAG